MGLGIIVGIRAELTDDEDALEWFEGDLAQVNRALTAQGLAAHAEPAEVGEWDSQAFIDSMPYSFLHVLRGAYAGVVLTGSLPAASPGGQPGSKAVAELAGDFFHHLLQHSDAEGWYVPVDFAEVIIEEDLPGSALGSVPRLQAELLLVAPALGIEVTEPGGPVTAAALAAIEESSDAEDDDADPFWRAREIWLTLYDATRQSLASGAAIVFS